MGGGSFSVTSAEAATGVEILGMQMDRAKGLHLDAGSEKRYE